jgi:molybdenum cofactor biosynthesis enzyme MoaA
MLRNNGRSRDVLINSITLSPGLPGGDICNFKCVYCTSFGTSSDSEDNVYGIIQQIGELPGFRSLVYNCGEITISPYKHEILQYWKIKKWKGEISTNAAVYMEEIGDLLCDRLITLNVSLDSGSAETFAKIKGVNCFEKVTKNLEKYAVAGGKIQLKYVVIGGINDNKIDVDGFVTFAERINAQVKISRDLKLSFKKMSEKEYSTVLQLARQCTAMSVPYSIREAYLFMDTNRLKKDGVVL